MKAKWHEEVIPLAENVLIQKKDNITKIFIDGTEIRNVISYELFESVNKMPVIKLEVNITGEIESQLK